VELFEQIRREYEHGVGTIKGVARKFKMHRRMVREALGSATHGWPVIRLAADSALGTSRRQKLFLLGFPMHTSNRSVFRHYSRSVSATGSNRRVRTRTHGGVAGVGR
jgi:hypothetical protein